MKCFFSKQKRDEEREKLRLTLQTRIEAEKIVFEEFNNQLKQFDLVWENKIQNEIAKRIDKAYLYSFNDVTYKSNV